MSYGLALLEATSLSVRQIALKLIVSIDGQTFSVDLAHGNNSPCKEDSRSFIISPKVYENSAAIQA